MDGELKLKVWCDSGANARSKYERTYSLKELGLNPEEWKKLTDAEQECQAKELALECFDWGFELVEGESK
jgi:hypothetical protein